MRQFQNLQAMRGIAALLVLAIHSFSLRNENMGAPGIAVYFWSVGPAGVDIFFVISGFIITIVAQSAARSPASPAIIAKDFLLKRIIRIYPMFWVAMTVSLVLFPWAPVSEPGFPQHPLWRLYLLIEQQNFVIVAAWTLAYEMYFYLVVATILLISPKRLIALLALWAALSLALVSYAAVFDPRLLSVPPFSPLLGEFLLGVVVAVLIGRGATHYPIASIAVGIIWLVIGGEINRHFFEWRSLPRFFLFGPGAALLVYGVLAAELRSGWTFSRPWQRIGDASYSIYVWHQPLLFALLAAYTALGVFNYVPPWAMLVPSFLIVIAWGFLSFHTIERPSQKWLGQLLLTRKTDDQATHVAMLASIAIAAVIASYPAWPHFEPRPYIAAGIPDGGALDQPLMVVLPELPTIKELHLAVESASNGRLYVGYHSDGALKEESYPVPPGLSNVTIALPQEIDNNGAVWVRQVPPYDGMVLKTAEIRKRLP